MTATATWTRPNSHATPKVGMIADYFYVTDSSVHDVVDVTPNTITLRARSITDTILDSDAIDGNPFPRVTSATVSNPDASTKTYRRRKDGTYRYGRGRNAKTIRFYNTDPGRVVDYRM